MSKSNKRFEEVLGFRFMLHKKFHVHLVKSSTMVRKKRAPECVGILCGPQISQCNKSKGALVDIELRENISLVCLAMGQTL
jgi:hypothetical protein